VTVQNGLRTRGVNGSDYAAGYRFRVDAIAAETIRVEIAFAHRPFLVARRTSRRRWRR